MNHCFLESLWNSSYHFPNECRNWFQKWGVVKVKPKIRGTHSTASQAVIKKKQKKTGVKDWRLLLGHGKPFGKTLPVMPLKANHIPVSSKEKLDKQNVSVR